MRKTVLCYGDSNTWGFDPATQQRFPRHVRWPGVLAEQLGDSYDVIPEGLNGRTTVWDDPILEHRNGKTYLIPCLQSHRPIDLVVLMLGTNDLKKRFSVSALDIGRSIGVLLDIIQKTDAGPGETAPKVLLIAPPPIGPLSELAEMFEGAEDKSRKLTRYYREQAELYGSKFLDASSVIESSPIDGLHFEAGEHQKLGKALAMLIKEIFE